MGISDDIRPVKQEEEKEKPITIIEKEPENETDHFFHDDFFKPEKAKPEPLKNKAIEKIKEKSGNFIQTLDKRYLWLLLIPILLIVIFQNYSSVKNALQRNNQTKNSNSNTDTVYNGEIVPQDYTVPDNANTNTAPTNSNVAATTPVVPAAQPATEVNKANISIKVLNGNGINNSASKIKTELQNGGFTVSKVTNASNYNYTTSIVYYKSGQEAEANAVKTALTSKQFTIEQSDTIAGSYDVVVLVGKN